MCIIYVDSEWQLDGQEERGHHKTKK
jgi:hypothetical protein